jgi:DNA-binding SARP family transcriptional activator/pimeloyl-ACP methyl ester carboxylesterase
VRVAALGPLELVDSSGATVPLTPRKARELLVVLALEHPRPVSVDTLVEALWDDPPPAAVKTVQAHLSRVRHALRQAGAPSPGVGGGPAGYRLASGVEVDVPVATRLVQSARRALGATGWSLALDHAAAAQVLVRGQPELPGTTWSAGLRSRVDDLRVELGTVRAMAHLIGGDATAALGVVEPLVAEFPLREHLWLLRISALASDGRIGDALRAYADVRSLLGGELGIEPGEELRRAEAALLAGRVPSLPVARRAPRDRPVTAPRPPAAPRFVEVDGAHIAHYASGSAPAHLVLLNPGTMPGDCVLGEPRLAAALDEVGQVATVTWFDRRGIGLSDRCTADALPSIEDWARDLLAVLDAQDVEQAVLLATEDTVPVAVHAAVHHRQRVAGLVLTNAHPRFTRGDDYPHGFDLHVADDSATDVMATDGPEEGFDLLSVIAPTVTDDPAFRAWWDDAGRRGASPKVARALRDRHVRLDIRELLPRVGVPVLHLVNPSAVAHDRGHDGHLAANIPTIETVELPGPDELWWLDVSGLAVDSIRRFLVATTAPEDAAGEQIDF